MTIKRLLKLIATLLLIAAGVIWHYRAPISETLAVWYDNEVPKIATVDWPETKMPAGSSALFTVVVDDDHLDYVERVVGLKDASTVSVRSDRAKAQITRVSRENQQVHYTVSVTAGEEPGPDSLQFAFTDGESVVEQNVAFEVRRNAPPKIAAVDWPETEMPAGSNTVFVVMVDDDHLDHVERVVGLKDASTVSVRSGRAKAQITGVSRENRQVRYTVSVTAGEEPGPDSLQFAFTDGENVVEQRVAFEVRRRPPAVAAFESDGELTLGQRGTLRLEVVHMETDPNRLAAYLESAGDALTVDSVQRRDAEPGRAEFAFGVRFHSTGRELPVSVHVAGETGQLTNEFKVNVAMPPFFSEEGSNFVEMVEAPDASIYGAHISLWRGSQEVKVGDRAYTIPDKSEILVTGHSVSSVCRVASGALFNYALRAGAVNDDFFMGAGLARIPRDDALQAEAVRINRSLTQYPEIYKLVRGALDFVGDTSDLQSFLLAASRPEVLGAARSVASNERNAYVEEHRHVTRATKASLDRRGARFVKRVLAEPSHMVELARAAQLARFQPALDELARLDDMGRRDVLGKIQVLVEHAESVNELEQSLATLDRDTGLLKNIQMAKPDLTAMKVGVRSFADNPAQAGSLALGDRAFKGVALMPYYVKGESDALSFVVPRATFHSNLGERARDLFRSSVFAEMQADMYRAAERFTMHAQSERTALDRSVRASRVPGKGSDAWLNELLEYQIYSTDATGRRQITGKKTMPRYRAIVSRIETIVRYQMRAAYFRNAAEQLAQRQDDEKLQEIQDLTLLDSFLRKWDLAFSDDSLQSPYRQWIDEKRDEVWKVIIEQARAKGIDVRRLITESTVFRVTEEGDDYRVRPIFVADLASAHAIKAPGQSLVWYENPWDRRRFDYLEEKDTQANQCGESWAAAKNDPESGLRTLAECYLRDDSEGDTPATRRRIRTALRIDPDFTANTLIERLWRSWDDPWPAPSDRAMFKDLTYETLKEIDRIDDPKLTGGTWPFPDQYLRVALYIGSSLNKLESQLVSLRDQRAALDALSADDQTSLAGVTPGLSGPGSSTGTLSDADIQRLTELMLQERLAGTAEQAEMRRLLDQMEGRTGSSSGSRPERARLTREISQIKKDIKWMQDLRGTIVAAGRRIDAEYIDEGLEKGKFIRDSDAYYRFRQYGAVRGFHGILDVATCLSRARYALEQEEVELSEIKQKVRDCRTDMTKLSSTGFIESLGLKVEFKETVEATDRFLAKNWHFDSLERYFAGRTLDQIVGDIVSSGYRKAESLYDRGLRRKLLLDALVRLYWHSGQYRRALDVAVKQVIAQSDTDETRRVAGLIRKHQDEIIKAMVYSGGQIHRSVFGRKPSDWVVRPTSVDKIPLALAGSGGDGNIIVPPRSDFASFDAWRPLFNASDSGRVPPDTPMDPTTNYAHGGSLKQIALLDVEHARVREKAAAVSERVGFVEEPVGGATGDLVWERYGADVRVFEVERGPDGTPALVHHADGSLPGEVIIPAMVASGARALQRGASPPGRTGTLIVQAGDRLRIVGPEETLVFELPESVASATLTLREAGLAEPKRLTPLKDGANGFSYVTVSANGRRQQAGRFDLRNHDRWVSSLEEGETVVLSAQDREHWRALKADPEIQAKGIQVLMTENAARAPRKINSLRNARPLEVVEVVRDSDLADLNWKGDGLIVLLVKDWKAFQAAADRAAAQGLVESKQIAIIASGGASDHLSAIRESLLNHGALMVSVSRKNLDPAAAERIFVAAGNVLEQPIEPGRTIDEVVNGIIDNMRESGNVSLDEFLFEGYVKREPDQREATRKSA